MTDYRDYGWRDEQPTCAMPYIRPVVLSLLEAVPGLRVLDIGCGNGWLAGQLVDRGCEVVGIDASVSGIEVARRAVPDGRFAVLEIGPDLLGSLNEKPFDAVVSTEVIEHVYAPDQMVRVCWEALKPGGRFVVTTPYHGYLKNLAIALTGRFDRHVEALSKGGHIKFWSRSTLGRLLTEAGFADLRFFGAGRLPYLWKSMIVRAMRPE
jgi:2-polyprenyl-3-methyl-5-hydroxy-6-metoxy-1,4-benzoquinol methylase